MGRIENLDLRGIRDTCWALADHKPENSPEAKRRFQQFVNLAQNEIAKDLPFLFDETLIRTVVYPDVKPTLTSDTMEATADPWVLRCTLLDTVTDTATWEGDASWDGREVHLKDPAVGGTWHLFTIREAWTALNVRYITLDRPWPTSGDVGIEWRVYQHPVALPPNLLEVKAMQLLRDQIDYPVEFIAQGEAEYASLAHPNKLLPVGPPRKAYRRPMRRMQAPAFTPVMALNQALWDTASSPLGKFEYCFTYSIGSSGQWTFHGGPSQQGSAYPYPNTITGLPARIYPSFLESPPSEISAPATTTGNAIMFSLPNLDQMMGFGDNTTLRYNRAGVKKRIYRRRLLDTSAIPTWEARERWYLLAEVDGDVLTYTDNGGTIPDMGVPLLDNHGFQMVRMYPTPDQAYDLQIRALVAPPRLQVDTDTPSLPEGTLQALIARTMMFMYEAMGNMVGKRGAAADYEKHLRQIRKRLGTLRPSNIPRQRRAARVRRQRRTWRQYLTPEGSIV